MDRDDRRRYFVVGSVMFEVVTPLFRTRLEKDYLGKGKTSLQAFLNTKPVIHILFHLRHRNAQCCEDRLNCCSHQSLPLNQHQWKRLYSEKSGIALHDCYCKFKANHVNLEDLDITLSSLILSNCSNLTPAEDAAVQGLRKYKNDYLSHNTTGRISQTEYSSLWRDLTNFVGQLDTSKQDLMTRIKQRPMDELLCNNYTLYLLDIHKKLDEMDTSIQDIRSNLQGQNAHIQMDTSIQDIRSNLQGQNAHIQEILLYIRKDQSENFEQEKKESINGQQYTLGQDVFQLHHQINLTSHICKGAIGTVSDIVMMDDGRLVMCLRLQSRLLICNADGSQVDSIYLQNGSQCITAVNNFTVAVTLMYKESIEMYDINNKLKLKSISIPGMCWGSVITTINNKLVICGDNRLLIIDHQTGEVIQKIHSDCLPDMLHGSGDRIFYCDYNNNNLYWYSYTNDRNHILTLPSPPRRMTTLQDGSLYVVCEDTSVQHVSSDVKHYQTVTTKGLKNHGCLAYNPKQRKLVTMQIYQNNAVFDIQGIITFP